MTTTNRLFFFITASNVIEVSVLHGGNAAPEIEKALPNQETMIKVFLKGPKYEGQ